MTEHLIRRTGRYYYRRRVPIALVARMGRVEITRALGTADPAEARKRARVMAVEIDRLFAEAEAMPETTGARVDPASLSSALEHELSPPDESDLRPITEEEKSSQAARSASDWLLFQLSAIVHSVTQGNGARVSQGGYPSVESVVAKAKAAKGSKTVTDALAEWRRVKEPTPATVAMMERTLDRYRASGGPDVLRAATRQHVQSFVDALEGSAATRRAYLALLKSLFSVAVSAEWMDVNPATPVRVQTQKGSSRKRIPFTVNDLQTIADKLPNGGHEHWLPLLAMFSGARMTELGQLHDTDIKQESYPDASGQIRHAWVMYLTDDEEGQRLKNQASRRRVPVHPELERLGFVRFAQACKGRLFPGLKEDRYGRIATTYSSEFGSFLRKTCGITDTRKVFHSFRHAFKDALREHGVREDVSDAITGHTTGTVARGYGAEFYPLRPLVDAISTVQYHGLTLR